MALCPQCQSQLAGDFGMVVCHNCRAVSVIDFDGNITLDQSAANVSSEVVVESIGEKSVTKFTNPIVLDPLEEVEALGFQEPSNVQSNVPVHLEAQDNSVDWTPSSPESLNSYDEVPADSAASNNLDLSHFADSIANSTGAMTYDVYISGIDTREMRQLLVENLEDSRLKLDLGQILKRINNGEIKLSRLPAVKASTIVNRLKALPLEIRWIQHTIYE